MKETIKIVLIGAGSKEFSRGLIHDLVLDKLGWTNKVRAIIISHAHLDHVGGLPYLAYRYPKAVIMGTPFTMAVLDILATDEKINIKNKKITANILMLIAGIASFFIFHGQEGATAILLYAIAERLEELTADKSRNAIKELLELAPDDALLKTENGYKHNLIRLGRFL